MNSWKFFEKQYRNVPARFFWIVDRFGDAPIKVLDVGCGNGSPSETKKWLPQCEYFGLDREDYNITDDDKAAMATYFKADLDDEGALDVLKDEKFDVIIMSHIIEHLEQPEAVVQRLSQHLQKGGAFYIEFPSEKSPHFPSLKKRGIDITLNFYDDPTHITVVSRAEVSRYLENSGLTVERTGIFRNYFKIALAPAGVLLKMVGALPGRNPIPFGLWDIFGFRAFVLAKN